MVLRSPLVLLVNMVRVPRFRIWEDYMGQGIQAIGCTYCGKWETSLTLNECKRVHGRQICYRPVLERV